MIFFLLFFVLFLCLASRVERERDGLYLCTVPPFVRHAACDVCLAFWGLISALFYRVFVDFSGSICFLFDLYTYLSPWLHAGLKNGLYIFKQYLVLVYGHRARQVVIIPSHGRCPRERAEIILQLALSCHKRNNYLFYVIPKRFILHYYYYYINIFILQKTSRAVPARRERKYLH